MREGRDGMKFAYILETGKEEEIESSPKEIRLRLSSNSTHVTVEANRGKGWAGVAWLAKIDAPSTKITMFSSLLGRFGFKSRGAS